MQASARARLLPLLLFLAGGLVFCFVMWIATRLPGVPYNVRELFIEERGWLSIWLFYLFLVSVPLAAAVVSLWVSADLRRWLWTPLIYVGSGMVTWWLLSNAVTLESLWDILGTPILKWPGNAELAFRFLVLYMGILAPMVLAAGITVLVSTKRLTDLAGTMLLLPLAVTVMLVVIGYLLMVPYAATDNVRELFAVYESLPSIDLGTHVPLFYVKELYRDYDGLSAVIAIYPIVFLFSLSAAVTARGFVGASRWVILGGLMFLVSAVSIWLVIPRVLTQGAIVFVFGPNRDTVLAQWDYFLRYLGGVMGMTAILVFGDWFIYHYHRRFPVALGSAP